MSFRIPVGPLTRLAAVIAAGVALAGCGQTGPLYLPKSSLPTPTVATAPAGTPATVTPTA